MQATIGQLYSGAPDEIGDVPAIVGEGQTNPVYAVTLWELNNNARPCGTKGFTEVNLQDILDEANNRTDGYARQGVDQTEFIPESMQHPDMLPPALLASVWGVDNPNTATNGGNR
jgi:hypothetical protein